MTVLQCVSNRSYWYGCHVNTCPDSKKENTPHHVHIIHHCLVLTSNRPYNIKNVVIHFTLDFGNKSENVKYWTINSKNVVMSQCLIHDTWHQLGKADCNSQPCATFLVTLLFDIKSHLRPFVPAYLFSKANVCHWLTDDNMSKCTIKVNYVSMTCSRLKFGECVREEENIGLSTKPVRYCKHLDNVPMATL